MNKRQKELLQHQLDSEQAILKELEQQYRRALDDIMRTVRILRSDELTQSQIYQLQYQLALKGTIEAAIEKLHSGEFTTIQQYLKACYTDGFTGTMYDLAGQGIPMILPIDQKTMIRAIQTDSKLNTTLYDALGIDTKKLKRTIRQEITRGLAEGMATSAIARNISNASGAPLYNAKRIARTEGHRVLCSAQYDAQQESISHGADVVKQWDSTLDGHTRPTHRMLDGQIREVDEPFESGGKTAMYPGDFGEASEDCNCRCSSLSRARSALDEKELATLKERAEYFGLDKTKDFEDFKKKYLKAADESEQQYGVRYGEDAIDVDREIVDSKAYKAAFSALTDNDDVNRSIYSVAKDVLAHCDGSEHEDMYLINAGNGSIISKVTDSTARLGVNYSDEFKAALKNSMENDVPMIAIHNHPHGTPPSADDFRKTFENNYAFGVAVGHNGQIYRYEKPTKAISKEDCEAISQQIGILVSGGTDIDRACQMVYDEYGLKYTILEGDEP